MGEFDELKDYTDKNEFEREETQRLNKELLRCGDTFSLDVVNCVVPDKVSSSHGAKTRLLAREAAAQSPIWGFKGPRNCLTYACWAT